ncbi:MAG TPA: helix-turn-helix transcriptional regulator [Vicinamibacterales bacterium]|nr:helix-turn-helix transcriptional regulator [Vicinamibacterales bacterium]
MVAVKGPEVDFGARMRQAREQRGVSLRQIAERTKISVSQLEALERNDISRLPGGIFSRAFVRSYAAEIGVDPEQTVREFLSQFPDESVTVGSPHVLIDDGARGERRLDARAVMIVATLVVVAAAIILWSLR